MYKLSISVYIMVHNETYVKNIGMVADVLSASVVEKLTNSRTFPSHQMQTPSESQQTLGYNIQSQIISYYNRTSEILY